MKKLPIAALLALLLFGGGLTACSDDTPCEPTIFPTTPIERNTFEQWLETNYRRPYNIRFKYKLEDIETDLKYNVIPADLDKTAKLAIITKYLWFDAYAEVVGDEFLKVNAPRIIQAIGISGYIRNEETLGSAEGGYKVILGKVNDLTDETIRNYETMTGLYFHTMHHEFTHILNQKKPYNPSFDQISRANYSSGNWRNISTLEANRRGFVSSYAMQDAGEDFAETLSFYVTYSPEKWQKILDNAGRTGAPSITQKIAIVKDYAKTQWGLDLDDLRDVILRRGLQVPSLDLEHFN